MPLRTCIHCSGSFPQADMHRKAPGKYICTGCLSQLYKVCPDCGKHIAAADFSELPGAEGSIKVCSGCAASYKECKICGAYAQPSTMNVFNGKQFVCKSCTPLTAYDEYSKQRKLLSELQDHIDLEGKKVYLSIMPSAHPDRPSGVFPTLGVWTCTCCGQQYFVRAGESITYLELPEELSREGATPKAACPKCAKTKRIYSCGHVADIGTGLPIPRVLGSAVVDADGVPERNPLPDRLEDALNSRIEVCALCATNGVNGQKKSSGVVVQQYSYTPTLCKYTTVAPPRPEPLMGFELEVDGAPRVEEAARKVLHEVGRKHVYIKKDGSLQSGFEQVTHPATLGYYMQERSRYEKLLSIPRAFNFKSHDIKTCGLHVHVDREFFAAAERDLGIRKVLYLSERFYPEIFIFSRRDAASAETWAKRWLDPEAAALMCAADVNEIFEAGMTDGNRRKLVNLQKRPTMEFRIFRGTLNAVTFWATLQLVRNIVCIAKETSPADLDAVTWRQIVDLDGFTELREYNEHRVGDGWDGLSAKVRTKPDLDAGPDRTREELSEIPSVLTRDKVKVFQGYYFKADNEALLALWAKIETPLRSSGLFSVEGAKRGERYVMTEAGRETSIVKSTTGKLVKIGVAGETAYKWLVIYEGFMATLPTAVQEAFIPAADRVISCVTITQ